MNKKIISLLIGATMLASTIPAMATTEGIIQGDVMMTSEMIELNTFNGVVKEMTEENIVVTIEEADYTFVPVEGMILDDIKVGDTVEVKSPSALATKDIKEATAVTKIEADALNAYEGILKSADETRATVEIDGVEYSFMLGEKVDLTDIEIGEAVKVLSASALATKDIKEAAEIIKADTAVADGEDETVTAVPKANNYNSYNAVVNEVTAEAISVTIDGDMVVSFRTSEETTILSIDGKEAAEVKKDDKVIVVSTSLLMTKDIKFADIIIINNEEKETAVYFDKFDVVEDQLVSADGNLVLNVEDTAEYAGKNLLVFYTMQTMSIPAQTTPDMIVVLSAPEAEAAVSISFNVGNDELDINGEKVKVEVAPYIIGEGTTLVPLRVISEAFGAEVAWDGETKTVTIVDGESEIKVVIGSKTALVNGEEKAMEEAPELLGTGVTMVPLRFISESLGSQVGYEHETQLITVSR